MRVNLAPKRQPKRQQEDLEGFIDLDRLDPFHQPQKTEEEEADRPPGWATNDPHLIQRMSHHRLLTREEEVDLVTRYQAGGPGAKAALDQLIRCNQRLVMSVAKHHTGRGLEIEDLIQCGNLGLLEGIRRFDPTRGFKLSTYVTQWIRQAIQRGLQNDSRTIRLPVHQHEKIQKVRRAIREFVQAHNVQPTLAELAQATQLKRSQVAEVLSLHTHIMSLDVTIQDAGGTDFPSPLGATIPCPNSHQVETRPEATAVAQTVEDLLAFVNRRERLVLSRRFGLEDGVSWTLAQVAELMNVSRERVRQIEHRALLKLSRYARGRFDHIVDVLRG